MATYIAGVTDYIPQVQPFKPDFNFYQDVMQRKQQKFDMGWKQVNTMYNSMLNAPMTRTDNQEARDKFFTEAQTEIERLGSIDLSLEQNVASAYEAFKPFYEDDYVVNDISWTKKYNDARMKSNSFKNCIDPEKCGGRHWDGGDQYLEYQRKEFMDASAEDALGFARPEYIADPDIDAMSLKYFDESKLSVTQDIDTGQWIVTQTNGKALVAPLQSYLTQRLGKDQKVLDYYKVKSFLLRQSNPEEAERLYNEMTSNTELTDEERKSGISAEKKKEGDKLAKRNFRTSAEYLKAKSSTEKGRLKYLTKRRSHLAEKYGGKGFDMSALPQDVQDEFRELDDAITMQDGISKYFQDTSNLARSVEKMEGDKTAQMDNIVAAALLNQEVAIAASTLAYRDFKQTQKANPYAVSLYNHQLTTDREARKMAVDFMKTKFEAKSKVTDKRFELMKDILTGDNKSLINRLFGPNMLGPSGSGGESSSESPLQKFLEAMVPDVNDGMYDAYIETQMALYPDASRYYYSAVGGAPYNISQGYNPKTTKGSGVSQITSDEGLPMDINKMTASNLPKVYKEAFKELGLSDEELVVQLKKAAGTTNSMDEIIRLKEQRQPKSSKDPVILSGQKITDVLGLGGSMYDQGSIATSTTLAKSTSLTNLFDISYDELGGKFGDILRKVNTPEAKAIMKGYDDYGMSVNRMLQVTDLFINTANAEMQKYIDAETANGDKVAAENAISFTNGLFDIASMYAEGYGESSDLRRGIEEVQMALVHMGSDIATAVKELPENQTLISKRGMTALQSWPTFQDDNWHAWFNDNKGALLENNNLIKLLGGSSSDDYTPIGGASRRFLNNYLAKNKNFVYDETLTSINAKPLVQESGKPGEKGYSFITNDGEKIEVISEEKYLELTKRDQESRWTAADSESSIRPLTAKETTDIARYEAVSKNGYTTPRFTNEKFRDISLLNPLFNGSDGFSIEQSMKYANTTHNNQIELNKKINENLINAWEQTKELRGINSLTPETDDGEINTQNIAIAHVIEHLGRIDANGKFIKNTNANILNNVFADILSPEGMAKYPELFESWARETRGFMDLGDVGTSYVSTFSQIEQDNAFKFSNDNLMKFIFGTPEFTELSQSPEGTVIKGGNFWSPGTDDPMFAELKEFSRAITSNRTSFEDDYGTSAKNFHANIIAAYNAGEIKVSREGENLILTSNNYYYNEEGDLSVSLPLDEIETHSSFEEVNEEIRDGIGEADMGKDSNPFYIFTEKYFAQPSPYSAVDGIGTTSVPATIYKPSLDFDLSGSNNYQAGAYVKEELQELVDMGPYEMLSDGTHQVDLFNGRGDDGDDLSISTADGLKVVQTLLRDNAEGFEDDREMGFEVIVQPMALDEQDRLAGRFNVKEVTIKGLKSYSKDKSKKNTGLLYDAGYNQKVGTGADATYTGNPFPDQITFKVYNSKTKTALAALNKDPYLMSLSMGKPIIVNDFNKTAGSMSLEPVINKEDMSKSMVSFNSNMKLFDIEKGMYVDDIQGNLEIAKRLKQEFGIMDGNIPLNEVDNEVVTTIYSVLKDQRIKNLILREASPELMMARKDNNTELEAEIMQTVIDALNNL
jgi:hypothetical protein